MDARQLRLLARRRLGRSDAKPGRIRSGGVAAVRSFVARGGVRRRVVDGLLGVESACARAGDRDAGAAIPVTAQRDAPIVGAARRPGGGTRRGGGGQTSRQGVKESRSFLSTFPPRSLSTSSLLPLSLYPPPLVSPPRRSKRSGARL